MEDKNKIIEYCNSLGLDTIGFTKCRYFEELIHIYELRKQEGKENPFEESDIEKRVNPFFLFPEGRTIISVAFPYRFNVNYNKNKGFSLYTLGEDYHTVVRFYLDMICNYIEKLGGKARAYVDSNPLPERYIAYLSGVGFIGKNNMLITEKYGSFVFLGEIITDIELEEENNNINLQTMLSYEKCGECELCFNACPTKAINGNGKNPNLCLSYITQKRDIENHWFKLIGGRLFGCDTCQHCCPYNNNIKESTIGEFAPKEYMLDFNLEEIITMDKKTFESKYKKTSCGWRGKNVLQRNGLIYAKNNNLLMEGINVINSPYVKDYYNRLLSKDKL